MLGRDLNLGQGRTLRIHLTGVARACCPALHLLLLLAVTISWSGGGVEGHTRLKIGALLDFNSTIGQVALAALQGAVLDVNANTSILPDYELVLDAVDSSRYAFQGAVAAVEVWKENVVAVVGPQTSPVAQFAADVGAETQVPVVSFAATDPALTKKSNSYFLRTTHSDAVQMNALAALIKFYGWRKVSAVSTKDDVGLNSLEALSDALNLVDISLVKKTTIPQDISSRSEMKSVLTGLPMQESRVIVVHLPPKVGRLLFTTAQSMAMMTTGYVWLMSEAMSVLSEVMPPSDPLWPAIEGVVAVRSHVPSNKLLSTLKKRWNTREFTNSSTPTATEPLNIYGMYAYDTLRIIAQAMDKFVRSGKNFTFAPRSSPTTTGAGNDLAGLKVFEDGDSLLKTIRDTRFMGTSGLIEFNVDGDRVGSVYEIMNFIAKGSRVVGFWNADQGFSSVLKSNDEQHSDGPASPYSGDATQNTAQLLDVIWPGGSAQVPKVWAVNTDGQKLRIGVPFKVGFEEFVRVVTDPVNGTLLSVHGFCIDVFEAAVRNLTYPLNFTYVPYGNRTCTPHYDDLVSQVANKTFDAVVGDTTLTINRSKIVDFTQPYTSSGLVVLARSKSLGASHAWVFLRPFTPKVWITTGILFVVVGLTVWALERKDNPEFQGTPLRQIADVFWFICSTLFFSQRERVNSYLTRTVLNLWLIFVFIFVSSYTANLASILTVPQLGSKIQGFRGLVSSNLKIGYQSGSFVEKYLLQLNVCQDRLVPLQNQIDYANALKNGSVGAVVDELPYIQLFLSDVDNCGFHIAGQAFTTNWFGFVFPKGSQLARDLSTAILQLAEDGRLQEIHDNWLKPSTCDTSASTTDELGLDTFWVLFVVIGGASILCVFLYYAPLIWEHIKACYGSVTRLLNYIELLRSLFTGTDTAQREGAVKGDLERKLSEKQRVYPVSDEQQH